jgi:hypothetical protein
MYDKIHDDNFFSSDAEKLREKQKVRAFITFLYNAYNVTRKRRKRNWPLKKQKKRKNYRIKKRRRSHKLRAAPWVMQLKERGKGRTHKLRATTRVNVEVHRSWMVDVN